MSIVLNMIYLEKFRKRRIKMRRKFRIEFWVILVFFAGREDVEKEELGVLFFIYLVIVFEFI